MRRSSSFAKSRCRLLKQLDVSHSGGVSLIGGQASDAGAQATVNVKLQARVSVLARKIDLARGNLEMPVNKVH